jgi:hypothetical protein
MTPSRAVGQFTPSMSSPAPFDTVCKVRELTSEIRTLRCKIDHVEKNLVNNDQELERIKRSMEWTLI